MSNKIKRIIIEVEGDELESLNIKGLLYKYTRGGYRGHANDNGGDSGGNPTLKALKSWCMTTLDSLANWAEKTAFWELLKAHNGGSSKIRELSELGASRFRKSFNFFAEQFAKNKKVKVEQIFNKEGMPLLKYRQAFNSFELEPILPAQPVNPPADPHDDPTVPAAEKEAEDDNIN